MFISSDLPRPPCLISPRNTSQLTIFDRNILRSSSMIPIAILLKLLLLLPLRPLAALRIDVHVKIICIIRYYSRLQDRQDRNMVAAILRCISMRSEQILTVQRRATKAAAATAAGAREKTGRVEDWKTEGKQTCVSRCLAAWRSTYG